MPNKKQVLVFLAFLFVLPFLYDAGARRLLASDPIAALVHRATIAPPAFLAIGSSRVAAGLDTNVFESGLVIWSVPFMDIPMMDMVIRKHEEVLKKSGQVFLEFSPEMFFIQTLRHQPEGMQALAAMGLRPGLQGFYFSDPRQWQVGAVFSALTQVRLTPREILQKNEDRRAGFRRESPGGIGNGGFLPRPRTASAEELRASSRLLANMVDKYENREAENRSVRIFRKMNAWLSERGIRYCWLEMPKSDEFLEARTRADRRIKAAVADLLSEHSCFSNESFVKVRSDLKFQDANHLQAEGAFLFSKFLFEERAPRGRF
ncbi:MAG TPA: hypothetical protein PL182_11345 [Pseudobdellovibrionaceae bacterium]|nr:hypothetical protein [Pseudobdellovibrionaceae bacterium]